MPSPVRSPDPVVRLDAWLPQTQCTRCGYPGCRAYAAALAAGHADIDRCPPGGDVTLQALAKLLGVTPKPLDPACGAPAPRTRAVIDEARCIGCRKCLDVCPVDAVVGTHRRSHTVLAAECNGCGLCLPPCPVDCIVLAPVPVPPDAGPWPDYTRAETARWRARTERRLARLALHERKRARPHGSIFPSRDAIRRNIAAVLDRVKVKRERHAQD